MVLAFNASESHFYVSNPHSSGTMSTSIKTYPMPVLARQLHIYQSRSHLPGPAVIKFWTKRELQTIPKRPLPSG